MYGCLASSSKCSVEKAKAPSEVSAVITAASTSVRSPMGFFDLLTRNNRFRKKSFITPSVQTDENKINIDEIVCHTGIIAVGWKEGENSANSARALVPTLCDFKGIIWHRRGYLDSSMDLQPRDPSSILISFTTCESIALSNSRYGPGRSLHVGDSYNMTWNTFI